VGGGERRMAPPVLPGLFDSDEMGSHDENKNHNDSRGSFRHPAAQQSYNCYANNRRQTTSSASSFHSQQQHHLTGVCVDDKNRLSDSDVVVETPPIAVAMRCVPARTSIVRQPPPKHPPPPPPSSTPQVASGSGRARGRSVSFQISASPLGPRDLGGLGLWAPSSTPPRESFVIVGLDGADHGDGAVGTDGGSNTTNANTSNNPNNPNQQNQQSSSNSTTSKPPSCDGRFRFHSSARMKQLAQRTPQSNTYRRNSIQEEEIGLD